MLEYLKVIAESWPLAVMVVFLSGAFVLNRRWKQYQEDQAAIYNLRSTNAVTVHHVDDAG